MQYTYTSFNSASDKIYQIYCSLAKLVPRGLHYAFMLNRMAFSILHNLNRTSLIFLLIITKSNTSYLISRVLIILKSSILLYWTIKKAVVKINRRIYVHLRGRWRIIKIIPFNRYITRSCVGTCVKVFLAFLIIYFCGLCSRPTLLTF